MNLAHTLLHLGRCLRAAAAEAHYARTRLLALSFGYEGSLPEPGAAPADYAEFLLRTSVPLLHEPSARARLRATAGR